MMRAVLTLPATPEPPSSPIDFARHSRFTGRMAHTLDTLQQTIAARRSADPSTSYVARLFAAGRPKIAQKVGEEAVETVIAAMSSDRKALVSEASDLIFHLGVLLAEQDLGFADVMAELERREGLSGIAEKAARPSSQP